MKLKNRERGALPQADRKKSNVLLVEFLPKVNRNGVADVWCLRQHRHWTPFLSDKSVVEKTAEGANTVGKKTAEGAKKTGKAIKNAVTP